MMHGTVSNTLRTGLASLVLLALPHAYAQNVDLLVKHFAVSTGSDGIKRSTEFSERLTRTQNIVWISRVLPSGAHSDHDHAKGGDEHKHLDASTASRWITRAANGDIHLRLVPNDEKVLVTVTKTDYGNVGFDGSWAAAWSLIDPATLKRMKAGPTVGDLTPTRWLKKIATSKWSGMQSCKFRCWWSLLTKARVARRWCRCLAPRHRAPGTNYRVSRKRTIQTTLINSLAQDDVKNRQVLVSIAFNSSAPVSITQSAIN